MLVRNSHEAEELADWKLGSSKEDRMRSNTHTHTYIHTHTISLIPITDLGCLRKVKVCILVIASLLLW